MIISQKKDKIRKLRLLPFKHASQLSSLIGRMLMKQKRWDSGQQHLGLFTLCHYKDTAGAGVTFWTTEI